jgi:uncharacterized membrane protein HdeD (DUF308 family)
MAMERQTAEQIGTAFAGAIRQHWGLFLAEGILLVILGLLAIAVPWLATLAATIFIGWIFLLSGVVGLITTFWARGAPGFWWSLISAIIAIAAGVVLLVYPISGVLSLTLVLIAFFIIEGIASIMYAIEHRNQLTGQWVWMLISGIIDLILAAIIFAGLPGTAAWALGLGGIRDRSLVGVPPHQRVEPSRGSARGRPIPWAHGLQAQSVLHQTASRSGPEPGCRLLSPVRHRT